MTYTGLTSLIMIGLLETSLSKDYLMFYIITAGASFISLIILLFLFTEKKFSYDREYLLANLKIYHKTLTKRKFRSLASSFSDNKI